MPRELDPTGVWSTVCDLLRGTVRDLGAGPGQIAAVTATSQRQGVVFLDAEGGEIYAGPNLDLRAVFEGAEIDDRMGAEVYRTTGHAPSLLFAPAKLRWFQIHSPESYARIATVLCLADWLIYRLSGELVSEPSLAGEAGFAGHPSVGLVLGPSGRAGACQQRPHSSPGGRVGGWRRERGGVARNGRPGGLRRSSCRGPTASVACSAWG